MEVSQVLHMKTGDGSCSYAKNSSFQKLVEEKAKHILEGCIQELCRTQISRTASSSEEEQEQEEAIRIADLGCGSGFNSLSTLHRFIQRLNEEYHHHVYPPGRLPSFQIFLNDLSSNDFNSIFQSLPHFYQQLEDGLRRQQPPRSYCFVAAVPGSFYARLFPENSIHFVHSNYSLHWLSQVPEGLSMNKGSIHIGKSSPGNVQEAYLEQFQTDLSAFLRMRSIELVPGGQVLLILPFRPPNPTGLSYLDLLEIALEDMVAEGLIEEKTLEGFNVPIYEPSMEEMRLIIEKEGSFRVNEMEAIQFEEGDAGTLGISLQDRPLFGEILARTIRAAFESVLAAQFGGGIMDSLFGRFAGEVCRRYDDLRPQASLAVSLVKRKYSNNF